MTDWEIVHKENLEEFLEDGSEETLQRSYLKLKLDNENHKQTIHEIRRKYELDRAMLREIQERNETLERSLEQFREKEKTIIEAAETRHRESTKEYEGIIANLEMQLASKSRENEELREIVEKNRASLSEIKAREAISEPEVDIVDLETRLETIGSLLREEKERRERADETIAKLNDRCEELENTSRLASEKLAEKTQALEEAREELAVMRTEMFSLKAEPASDSKKGNSLFAEVEDRRQIAVDTVKTLREKYKEAKRICQLKTTEVKILRSQRVMMREKWEIDLGNSLVEKDRLLHMYKVRVSELQRQLKVEAQKIIDYKIPLPNNRFYEYFHILLSKKKKEIEDLQLKIEDMAIQMLVQEEAKNNISKELGQWRYKANSLEADMKLAKIEQELESIENIQCNPLSTDSTNSEVLNDHPVDSTNSKSVNHEELPASSKVEHRVHLEKEARDTSKKTVGFSSDTVTEQSRPRERLMKTKKEYPIIYIPNEPTE